VSDISKQKQTSVQTLLCSIGRATAVLSLHDAGGNGVEINNPRYECQRPFFFVTICGVYITPHEGGSVDIFISGFK
jgi:hypothetical protein